MLMECSVLLISSFGAGVGLASFTPTPFVNPGAGLGLEDLLT